MSYKLADIEKNYPFLSCIRVGKHEYTGIVQNADNKIISLYNYNRLPSHMKTEFLDYGKSWWWESNRKLPINIFIGDPFLIFRKYLISFSLKECEILFGPVIKLSNMTVKKLRKKSVQLVRRVN